MRFESYKKSNESQVYACIVLYSFSYSSVLVAVEVKVKRCISVYQVSCFVPFPFPTESTVCNNGELRTIAANGRIEVCFDDTWGTVCSDFWSTPDATVACRELGFANSMHVHHTLYLSCSNDS